MITSSSTGTFVACETENTTSHRFGVFPAKIGVRKAPVEQEVYALCIGFGLPFVGRSRMRFDRNLVEASVELRFPANISNALDGLSSTSGAKKDQ